MRNICDFNIHLPRHPISRDDLNLSRIHLDEHLCSLKQELSDAEVSRGNLMILDAAFAISGASEKLAAFAHEGFTLTALLDPRVPDAFERIDRIAELGYSGIKFHPYFQNLADHDFYAAIGACHHAESRGLWLALCCSYGTRRVFENGGVRLLGALAQAGVRMPIIALHSGGRLALEVMSIAIETPNIYLDTSFSIPFWNGSSVEQDIAFAIRKVGVERCLFGSDRPYQSLSGSVQAVIEFLERHDFGDRAAEEIMEGTFLRLCGESR